MVDGIWPMWFMQRTDCSRAVMQTMVRICSVEVDAHILECCKKRASGLGSMVGFLLACRWYVDVLIDDRVIAYVSMVCRRADLLICSVLGCWTGRFGPFRSPCYLWRWRVFCTDRTVESGKSDASTLTNRLQVW